ncbi:MAG: phosphatidate cytidylyltransferase [Actinomycetota bacterium]|nr:phosphatidate cytidylyltransferase [Actinomycetota bacterium]
MAAVSPTPQGSLAPGVRPRGRNLPLAIASGVALAVLFTGSLAVHPYAFLAFFAVLVVIAVCEVAAALRTQGLRPATPVVLAAGLVMLFGAYASGPAGQALGLVLLVLAGLAWLLVDPQRDRLGADLAATCLMGLWVPFLASFIALLLARPQGGWAVLATVALAVTSDIAAFAFGSRFGRHPMASSVSPAKTWEGFAGGVATVLLIAGLGTANVPGFDVATALALGVAVCLAATVGDLAESMVKRDLGVKDLGGILPGHGGVMERADAIIFALPAAHLLLGTLRP